MTDFNNLFNVDALKKQVAEASNKKTDYPEIPAGKYEVKIIKAELGETKPKDNNDPKPMCKIQFKILDGDYKDNLIFYNKPLIGISKETGELTALPLHYNNEFLKSLKVFAENEIVFDDFDQYKDLLLDIAEVSEADDLSWLIEYKPGDDTKGTFPEFKVRRCLKSN